MSDDTNAPKKLAELMRLGTFELLLEVGGEPLEEAKGKDGRAYALASPGNPFRVRVLSHGSSAAVYMVRCLVDGTDAEPGYVRRMRADTPACFRGYACGRDLHEFLFAPTPVDDSASSSAAHLGEVSAVVYATRRVRLDESSSDDDDPRSRRSSAAIGARALPEKAAVKEFGVQARAGSSVGRLPRYRRRRRGDHRYEKVSPEIATLRLLYRDEMWWAREFAPPAAGTAKTRAASGAGAPCGGPPATSHAGAERAVKLEPKEEPEVKAETQGLAADSGVRRAAGETGRDPYGKRRRREGEIPTGCEVIERSD